MYFSFFPFSLSHSENYLVKWSSSGLVKDIDQLHNLRAVFTVSVFACACARLPVVAHCLFSHVTRHVGACVQSLYLLSSLRKSLARCMYLPRQSPLSNGSPRAEGSACTHWEHSASVGRYCPQEMNLWTQSQMLPKQFVWESLPRTQTHLQQTSVLLIRSVVEHPSFAVAGQKAVAR